LIKQYLNFTYNNIKSTDMGISHVNVDGGLFNEGLGANRNVIEQQNSLSDRRYFKRISLEPIQLDMVMMFNQAMTDTQLDNIFSWLMQDYFKELYFDINTDRIYYCMPINQPSVTHNGNGEGYLTITMRCFDGYIYSSEINSSFDLSTNTATGTTVTLNNSGHVDIYPLMTIVAKEANITIYNNTTRESTQLTGLSVGETITLDNENEEISTSVAGVYRFSNLNDVYVRILSPSTSYKITGKCVVTFKYRYKRKF
jgi:phage-related protein